MAKREQTPRISLTRSGMSIVGMSPDDALQAFLSGLLTVCNIMVSEGAKPTGKEDPLSMPDEATLRKELYERMNAIFSNWLAVFDPTQMPTSDDPMHDPDITIRALVAMQDIIMLQGIKELSPELRAERIAALEEELEAQAAKLREEVTNHEAAVLVRSAANNEALAAKEAHEAGDTVSEATHLKNLNNVLAMVRRSNATPEETPPSYEDDPYVPAGMEDDDEDS